MGSFGRFLNPGSKNMKLVILILISQVGNLEGQRTYTKKLENGDEILSAVHKYNMEVVDQTLDSASKYFSYNYLLGPEDGDEPPVRVGQFSKQFIELFNH